MEQSAAEWQRAGSPAVGEEAEVADAGKASRQHGCTNWRRNSSEASVRVALPAVVGVVLPAEADLGR